MRKIYIFMMVFALSLVLSGCNKKEDFVSANDSFSYYQNLTLNDTLYVFGEEDGSKIDNKRALTGISIQGIFAQNKSTFFYNNDSHSNAWLLDLKTNYNIKTENVTLSEMLTKYTINYPNGGYILYDHSNLESVNVATTIAGVEKLVMIDKSLELFAIQKGLTKKQDVTAKTEQWCFENYQTKLNNSALVQLRGDIIHLRDYAIAGKYMVFYQDASTTAAIKLRGAIHNFALDDAPIFGWGPGNEDSHVGIAGSNGQFTVPSDYCFNMTVLAAKSYFGIESVTQPNKDAQIKAESGKHYVSFIRSDGDNVQTWYNYFPFSENDLAATRGDFPMGWSIQPSLIDLGPTILKSVYDNAQLNDYFVCAVSGHGYMYPSNYPKLKDFTQRLSMYLRKTDLSVVQILDSDMHEKVVEQYSLIPELDGGMYMYGEKYIGGNGNVYWSKNGKPFVSFRESLWDTTPQDIANRVNNYSKDCTSIEGYTLINLHPWSMDYNDVVELVKLFNEDIVVVSPNNFIKLIKENVKK